jgi:hypothetical protein
LLAQPQRLHLRLLAIIRRRRRDVVRGLVMMPMATRYARLITAIEIR